MTNSRFYFTSESVSEGHPDRLADQVSDAMLDAYLSKDADAKVACECLVTTGQLILAGEITSTAHVDGVSVARDVARDIGYTDASIGFDYANAHYLNLLHEQSREIHDSVVDGGAGDQGLMFGFACDESPGLMPMPIHIAHRLMERQARLRKEGGIEWLLPDAKSQVTVLYADGVPREVTKVVLSSQHRQGVGKAEIRERIISEIILPVLAECLPGGKPEFLVNPSGSFTIGGPHGDTGLTGRKIIVDTYGGSCPHGGGAFSGKDPSKVDRSAAYMARYIAKHLVAGGLAKRCTVQLSYAIGIAEPTSVYVNTEGTGAADDAWLADRIQKVFDLTPAGIIRTLGLKRPMYRATAAYGHFGRAGFPWEEISENIIKNLKTE